MALGPLKGGNAATYAPSASSRPAAAPAKSGPAPASAALGEHASWFDINGDGIVQVKETAQRFSDLGVGGTSLWVSAAIATLALHKQTDSRGLTLDAKNVASEKGFGKTSVGLLRHHDRSQLEGDLNRLFGDKRALSEVDFENAVNDNVKRLSNEGVHVDYADVDRSHLQWKLLFRLAAERDTAGVPVLTRSRLREFFDPSASSPISFFANVAQRRVDLLTGKLQPGATSGPAPGSVDAADAAVIDRAASDRALMAEKGAWDLLFNAHSAAVAGLKAAGQK